MRFSKKCFGRQNCRERTQHIAPRNCAADNAKFENSIIKVKGTDFVVC